MEIHSNGKKVEFDPTPFWEGSKLLTWSKTAFWVCVLLLMIPYIIWLGIKEYLDGKFGHR